MMYLHNLLVTYYKHLKSSGFTLIETIIAMVISVIIATSVYQIYHVQQKSYLIQQQISEMQQRLRGTLDFLVNSIQMAGYDPLHTAGASLVSDFVEPNDIFDDNIDYTVDKDVIAFTVDDNEDGAIQVTEREHLAYRLRDAVIERYRAPTGTWEVIAEDIEALNFVYFDASGNVTNTLAEIRAVEVTLLAKSKEPDYRYVDTATYYNGQGETLFVPGANDHYRRRLLITRVQCRNLGF